MTSSDQHHSASPYPPVPGGLPPQTAMMSERAVFTESYAVIPREVMTDIVSSHLPHWEHMRMWVLARPMSGFSTTFSQYLVELEPGGGSEMPESDPLAQAVLYVTSGTLELLVQSVVGKPRFFTLQPGSYVYLPPEQPWSLHNTGAKPAAFHWIRKRYKSEPGVDYPELIVTHESQIEPVSMPDTQGAWSTTRFVQPSDLRHDMHVNVVSFEPGGVIPFPETHVMEHGLFVLQGKAVYRLNQDWVEVRAGDFIWLRAFCPQACYAGGPERFRYLLYKDVNRHMPLD